MDAFGTSKWLHQPCGQKIFLRKTCTRVHLFRKHVHTTCICSSRININLHLWGTVSTIAFCLLTLEVRFAQVKSLQLGIHWRSMISFTRTGVSSHQTLLSLPLKWAPRHSCQLYIRFPILWTNPLCWVGCWWWVNDFHYIVEGVHNTASTTKSPKHQSGPNFVWPTGKNEYVMEVCSPTRILHMKYWKRKL